MKRLTEAVEEHWKAMLHTAIWKAAQQKPLPYFDKAMVEIEIITPRGGDNARLWDTSNRAIQVVLNNLKGIFFEDDNMEHMAVKRSVGRNRAQLLGDATLSSVGVDYGVDANLHNLETAPVQKRKLF